MRKEMYQQRQTLERETRTNNRKCEKQNEESNLSQMFHNLFSSLLSANLHPEVAKDYLRNQLSCLARGWHLIRGWKLKTASTENFEVLAALLLQQLKNGL
jgi:uncharacterized membrane protein YccC